MQGKLFVVGTPIGNLQDITLRAIETLKMVDVIACEDTRVSIKLLNHLNIKDKKIITYHNFNEKQSSAGVFKLITEGKNVALISDAGMPTIADPGFHVILEAKTKNIDIEVIPGVSALTTAMSLSSMGPEFTFLAFGKPKKGQLESQIKDLVPGTYVFFVAPHKLEVMLDIINNFHPQNHLVFLAKELTKKFEQHFYGSVKEIKEQLNSYKGEFTLVLKLEKAKKEKINKYPKIQS